MTTTPNFEEFQNFSKQQLEAFTAASTTLTKGLQEIAAESTDYSKKAFAAGSAVVREAARRPQRRSRHPDPERVRQAGL